MAFGLVLGAGGSAGEAFHRGVVRAMHDLGLDARAADVIVGTSAGSIMAASLRRHASQSTSDRPYAAPPRRRLAPRRTALELARRPAQVLNAALLRPQLATGRVSLEFLQSGVRDKHQAWPAAALWIVAVERATGRRVVFGQPGEPETDVGSAVAASCAIPGVFSPVEIGGRSYVDGGVHSPTNADLLAGSGLDLVIISSPMSMPVRGARRRLDAPLRLLFQGHLRAEVWALRRRGMRVVTIAPDPAVLRVMPLNMMDGRGIHDIEERAYELARLRLRDVPLSLAARRP